VTFRVEVNYVEIDAIVTDAQGNFVLDLTNGDFEVVEEGKPQDLSVLSMVDIPIERTDAPLYSPTAIEPDVRSNAKEFNGRVFVLVLDDLQTHFGQRQSPAGREVVRRAVSRRERHRGDCADRSTQGWGPGVHEQPHAVAEGDQHVRRPEARSATLDKIDDYYMQRETNRGRCCAI
jgi:hypothetical protein